MIHKNEISERVNDVRRQQNQYEFYDKEDNLVASLVVPLAFV